MLHSRSTVLLGILFLVLNLVCSAQTGWKHSEKKTENNIPEGNLLIPFKTCIIQIDSMWGTPTLKKDSIKYLDTVNIILSSVVGIDADINNKILKLQISKADSVVMTEQYCVTYFFNNDGSGGVYQIDGIGEVCTEPIEMKQYEHGKYHTASMKKRDENFPKLTPKDMEIAKTYVNGEGKIKYAEYFLDVSNVYYVLNAFENGKSIEKKVIHFKYIYGD